MAAIKENVDLQPFNTFKIKANCTYFAEISSFGDFLALQKSEVYQNNKRLIIGGGSNLLLTKDFNGLVIKNNIKGIEVLSEDDNTVIVRAGAGEVWHDFVLFTLERSYGGLENLSLIPGCVGASPMQNIGAYGVEIKDVFRELEAFSLTTGERRNFNKEECEFGYRESVFKNKYKDRFLIASVTFTLSKKPVVNTSYGAINEELKALKVENPGIKDVSAAVINIRRSKLPDPAVTGNAGSFFKNPEVSVEIYKDLHSKFPNLVAYNLENGNYKLAAGWLIEQCGLKGFEFGGAAVHTKQALVLINKNNCTGKEVFSLSEYIIQAVKNKFDVTLEREVNIV